MAKLLGVGAHVCLRKLYCEIKSVRRGDCVVQVKTGRLAGSVFTATFKEVVDAQRQ